jgi:hypothetical protein
MCHPDIKNDGGLEDKKEAKKLKAQSSKNYL